MGYNYNNKVKYEKEPDLRKCDLCHTLKKRNVFINSRNYPGVDYNIRVRLMSICTECYEKRCAVCTFCKQLIVFPNTQAKKDAELIICSACLKKYKKCEECGKLLLPTEEKRIAKKTVCSQCYEKLYPEVIIASANKRGVTDIIHFTNVRNLESILHYGLLSVKELKEKNIRYYYNDKDRYDFLNNAISLSVTFPNYKMFYKLRYNNKNEDWAVLILDYEQVLRLPCVFCFENAASRTVSQTSTEKRMKKYVFDDMFADSFSYDITVPFYYSRKELNLKKNETTNPQAEILAMSSIPVSAIKCVVFNDYQVLNQYAPILHEKGIDCKVDVEYFKPRHDYEFWKKSTE